MIKKIQMVGRKFVSGSLRRGSSVHAASSLQHSFCRTEWASQHSSQELASEQTKVLKAGR
ncbi:MAG: hypothetical protein ABSA54_15955 [Terriglobales bacterium]|jgi:hypothetical protein